MTDREFKPANNMLSAMASKYLKSPASCNDNSYKSLPKKDLEALGTYFDRSNAKKLQEEVFFNILYHKGYRGREWIRTLKISNLKIHTDECGIEYADLEIPAFSKNTKGSVVEKSYSNNKQSLIYSTPQQKKRCPVEAIKFYFSKIPPNVEVLFPLEKKHFNYSDKYWYYPKQVLGKNTLGSMMKTVSTNANLSRLYTNHCVRATCVTQLANKGFSISEIQAVTGHKRQDSVQRYIKQIESSKKQKMSNALSESMSIQEHEPQYCEQSNRNVNMVKTEQSTERIFSNCLFSSCTININN